MAESGIVDRALASFGGDRELLQELSSIFLLESPPMLEAIRDALAARDAPRLDRSAHAFYGALASLGATDAARNARTLEMCGRHSTLSDAPAALAELEAHLAVVTQVLGEFRAETV